MPRLKPISNRLFQSVHHQSRRQQSVRSLRHSLRSRRPRHHQQLKQSVQLLSIGLLSLLISIVPLRAIAALQLDDSGAEVESLQRQLRTVGFYDGPISGYFGPLTESAVLQFQQTHNLAADGIAGDQTLTILSAAVSEAEAGRDFSSTGGLATGSQGTAVAELQTLLREAGYFNGTVTGFFGPETDAAVRQFQQASGLSVDGIAGQRTIAALRGNIPTTASSSSSSSSTTSVAADGSLSPGAEGILVSSLQEQLALLGFYRGTVDGLYGPQTVAAVEAFQTAHGLTTSGVADPTTQARIDQQILTQAQDPGTVAATTTAPAMPLRPEPSSSSAFTVTPVPTNLSRPPAINPSVVVPSSSTVTASPSSGTNYSVMPPSSSQINTSQSSIRELQEQLREMDFYSGSVDGQLGPSTNEAIREAQQRYGISPSDFE